MNVCQWFSDADFDDDSFGQFCILLHFLGIVLHIHWLKQENCEKKENVLFLHEILVNKLIKIHLRYFQGNRKASLISDIHVKLKLTFFSFLFGQKDQLCSLQTDQLCSPETNLLCFPQTDQLFSFCLHQNMLQLPQNNSLLKWKIVKCFVTHLPGVTRFWDQQIISLYHSTGFYWLEQHVSFYD